MIINEKYLKQFSPLPLNYNLAEVKNYIDVAEKIWILPMLGYDWYEELQQQVKDNSLTPENSTALVEAIWPYLGFAVAYEALPSIMYHMSETSITKGHSENSDALTLKELGYYQDHIRRQLEVRKEFCRKFICEHNEDFPLADFCACNCDCCCNKQAKLEHPNPWKMLYSTCRKDTRLR